MHFVFIPYGKRSEVELLLRDMEAQKHKVWMTKGKKKQFSWQQGVVRVLPLGAYEYIFPKEDIDTVLNTLMPKRKNEKYELGLRKFMIRRLFKCEAVPDFKRENYYLWIKDHVHIIPIGVRYDEELIETEGIFKGWTHEAL